MFIYKFIDSDNKVIYIGKTKDLKRRLRQHKREKEWFNEVNKIYFAECLNETDLNIYEVYFINKYTPIYNKKENYQVSFTTKMKELQFRLYTDDYGELESVSDSDLGKLFRLYMMFGYSEFHIDNMLKCLHNDSNKTVINFVSRIIKTKLLLRTKPKTYIINKEIFIK